MPFPEEKPQAPDWLLKGAIKDEQSITRDWQFVAQPLIAGVVLKEVAHVHKENGHLTEIFRRDWALDPQVLDQVFQVTLEAGKVSAWHAHEVTTDRIFANRGKIKLVLYDARPTSPTYQAINEFRIGELRPALIVIPPKVWHGIQNISSNPSSILNLVDQSYRYESPDHWRLPSDTPEIPYRFGIAVGRAGVTDI